ncbi:MAG TPA: hypothetical protein VFV78_14490 [Vicinamibacterales bacterium]|nr:hypothetical protein [Vicinamibacterales bacterium]
MEDIVAELPLSDRMRQGLCGAPSCEHDLLACVMAYERGEWGECEVFAARARVESAALPGAFLEAVGWAEELNDED